jgi:tight adherence protein B
VNLTGEVLARGFAAFSVVALGTISAALFYEWFNERGRELVVKKQLAKVQEMGGVGLDQGVLVRAQGGVAGPLLALALKIPALAEMESTLRQAAVNWSLGTFLLISAGSALAFAVFGMAATGFFPLALLGAAFGAVLPMIYARRKRDRRLREFEEALPDALDLLARAIRAGHPIGSGIKIVADEAGEPVAGEFMRTFEEQRFGLPFEDTMMALTVRVPLIDLRMLVTAILIQREVGGNLAEVLDNLGEVIRQRFTVHRQLRVHTAQGRLSGYVLAVLPIAVGSIIYMLNPEYVGLLFTHQVGRFMLLSAISLQLVGFLWIRRIINIEI